MGAHVKSSSRSSVFKVDHFKIGLLGEGEGVLTKAKFGHELFPGTFLLFF